MNRAPVAVAHRSHGKDEMKMLLISEITRIVPERDIEMIRGFRRTIMGAGLDIVRLRLSEVEGVAF